MSDKKPDNPPAFPYTHEQHETHDRGWNQTYEPHDGMTLRDYFASQAINGMLSKYGIAGTKELAVHGYEIADAILKEREEK